MVYCVSLFGTRMKPPGPSLLVLWQIAGRVVPPVPLIPPHPSLFQGFKCFPEASCHGSGWETCQWDLEIYQYSLNIETLINHVRTKYIKSVIPTFCKEVRADVANHHPARLDDDEFNQLTWEFLARREGFLYKQGEGHRFEKRSFVKFKSL